jgi:hypothetical protein
MSQNFCHVRNCHPIDGWSTQVGMYLHLAANIIMLHKEKISKARN